MTDWQDVEVSRLETLTRGIRLVVMRRADGEPLSEPPPGAHLDIQLAPGLIRQYSLCGDATLEPGSYVVAVKLEPSSRGGSVAVHALQLGARIRVGLVRDRFPVDSAAAMHHLVAGGIGITPILSMARHFVRFEAAWQLDYFGRRLDDMAFAGELQTPPYAPRVRLHPNVASPNVALRLAAAFGFPAVGTVIYVCGPAPMMRLAADVAAGLGWPAASVRMESFEAGSALTPPASAQAGGDRPFTLSLQRSGREILVGAGETALEAMRREGVDVDSSCESGVCGTCLTRVCGGAVDHRDSYLTDEERSAGNEFMPCVSRAAGERLIVDR